MKPSDLRQLRAQYAQYVQARRDAMRDSKNIAYPDAKMRRDENKARGACINDTKARTHGPATHGVLCAKCRQTHKGTK